MTIQEFLDKEQDNLTKFYDFVSNNSGDFPAPEFMSYADWLDQFMLWEESILYPQD